MEHATKQFRKRNAILSCLRSTDSHPSAEMVHEMLREEHPDISLATVYNCLETMAEAGLINHLNFDNGPSRFCPNLEPHVHLLDDTNNRVLDVQLKPGLRPEDVFDLPEGTCVTRMDACLHGNIPV